MKQRGRVATIELAVTCIYIIVAGLLVQVALGILPAFETPNWVIRLLILFLLLGLPVTLVLAWHPISRWVDSRGPEKLSPPLSLAPTIEQGPAVVSSEGASVSQVRPWVRCCARFIDILIFGLCLGTFLGFIAPAMLTRIASVIGLLLLFLWCFAEAVCLSTWGTTPGKGLLRVTVRNADGSRLNYRSALLRSVNVWIRGLGAGLPLVSIITLIVAYEKLTKNGITTWDQLPNFSVTYKKIGRTRVIVAALLLVMFISFIVFGMITT